MLHLLMFTYIKLYREDVLVQLARGVSFVSRLDFDGLVITLARVPKVALEVK